MLKRVSIQNFKSLKDVTLDLQKVNLLIGPNNSGKTNFLKALETIGYNRKTKRHEVGQLSFAKRYDNKIEFKLMWPSDKEGFDCRMVRFSFDGSLLDEEKGYYSNSGSGSIFDPNVSIPEYKSSNLDTAKIYKPDPNRLDKPGPVGRGESTVTSDASNLIAFFDRIRDEYPGTFAQIRADLAKCVPEFTEINFQNVESTDELVKQFGDKTFKRIGLTDGRQNTIYWADELSEGTLYFIALLCIINQPNPPKLLLLEEPEKGIHPRRIREVMDFIFRLAEEKDVQIILTTHNENVLNEFATRPEAVFVFDKDEEGATHVKNLQHDIIEPTNERNRELDLDPVDLTSNLSENWLYGLLGGVPAIP